LTGIAIYIVSSKILDRFGYDSQLALLFTAGVIVLAAIFTQPWNIAEDLSVRLGGFERAIGDVNPVNYTPTLLKSFPFNYTIGSVYYGVSLLDQSLEGLRNATAITTQVPDIGSDYKVTMTTISFDWLYYVIVFIIIAITFYVLKHFNRYVAIVAVGIEVALLLGISANLVVTLLLIALFVIASAWLIKKGYVVWAIYPIIVAVLLTLTLVSLPKGLLVIILSVLLYLSLIPIFYAIGLFIAGVGELVEHREKFGLKVKPKKVIEETAGEWDAIAVAVVLSGLFLASIALYGATILGIGTFLALSTLLFK